MFGYYGFDRRILYGILIGLVIISLMNISANEWRSIIITLPAVIIAITIHEYSHAKVADMLGDKTPRSQGRLTLNPLKHIDPFGLVLLIFANVGWGRSVEINPNNFTSNKSKSTCETLVALAGPISNLILAFLLILVARIISVFNPTIGVSFYGSIFLMMLDITITVNIGLGIFNLIPLPPLDGEKIFKTILPYRVAEWLERNSYILRGIFIVLWVTGFLGVAVAPVIKVVEKGMVYIVSLITAWI